MTSSEQRTDRPFRVGGVPYRVGDALVVGLPADEDLIVDRAPPSDLVTELRAGRIDAGLLSSIELFREPGYTAVRDIGIACTGQVRSVLLFLRTEPRDVKTLALDRSSETSVALARILLDRHFGATIEHSRKVPPTRRPDEVDADAVLMIGDAGLCADPGDRLVLDLGEQWMEYKGLPFVFALWLLRGDDEQWTRVLAGKLYNGWLSAKAAGIDDGTGGRIQYELGPAHWEGLEAFRTEAADLGLCERTIQPRWISVAGQASA